MSRRATVLFEVVLSLALFAGAAAFALSATRSVHTALEVSHREQVALDLATSTLARLELDLMTIADIRDGAADDEGADGVDGDVGWIVEAETIPSPFTGLTLVAVTVSETAHASAGRTPIEVTLRRLLRLRDVEAAAYGTDPLLEGLRENAP